MRIFIAEPIPSRASNLKEVVTDLIATDSALKDVTVHTIKNYLKNPLQETIDWFTREQTITIIDLAQTKDELIDFNKKGYAWWPIACKKFVEEVKAHKNQIFILAVFTDLPYSIAGEAWSKNLFNTLVGNEVDAFFVYDGKTIDKELLGKKLSKAVAFLK